MDNKDKIVLEQTIQIYKYLQKDLKFSPKKAFSVIYYPQEHVGVLNDHVEQCYNCKELFDSNNEGLYWESKFRHYCNACMYLVPENYDRGKR